MGKTRILAALLALLLLIALAAGCSATKSYDTAMEDTASSAPESNSATAMDWGTADSTDSMEMPAAEPTESASAEGETALDPADFTEKIIYSGYLTMQTTKFDEALRQLEETITSLGGFVQDSSVQGNTRTYADGTTAVVDRWATYTVRVPADQFNAFLTQAGNIGNVTDSGRSAQNVTSQYTDYEARLESLNIQEERLLAMLEESGDLESLITLEERLSEVRYEIESIERNLRDLDQRLAYSTVDINLQEVEVYTPTVPVQRTFGEKLADAFSDGWKGFVSFLSALVLWLVSSLPALVILAVVIVVVIVILRRRRRRKKRQETQEAE